MSIPSVNTVRDVVCPTCGGHFEALARHRRTPVYVCSTHRRKPGTCTNALALPIAETDDTVRDRVEGDVLDTRFIDELLTVVDTTPDTTAQLEVERARLRHAITNLVNSVAKRMPAKTVAPVVRAHQTAVE